MDQQDNRAASASNDATTADIALSTVVCGALGFALGFVTWVLLNCAYALTDVVWDPFIVGGAPLWLIPAVCVAGGAFLGWWNHHFKAAPESFVAVVKRTRVEGGYKVKHPVPAFISFLLPLAFGGPIGPEAGLTGFIAAGCTRIGGALTRVRTHASELPSKLSRGQKVLVYGVGIVGGIAGVALYGRLFGGMSVPRFGVPEFSMQALLWIIPLTFAGMALSGVMRLGTHLSAQFARYAPFNEIQRAALCGLVLGVVALVLPYVLFPGTEQLGEVLGSYSTIGAVELAFTSLIKMLMLTFCLAMGWQGGPFFPLIFCASCLGLSIALVADIDPSLCVIVVTSALLGRFTRKIGLAAAILLLCVPVRAALWAVIPLVAGVSLPTIEELAARTASK